MADENQSTIVIKKIKKAAHAHHGGAWKVAYADFVTAMMAFFLTMWIMSMGQDQKEAIQDYFNDPMKYMFGSERFFSGVFSGSARMEAGGGDGRGGVSQSSQAGGESQLHMLAKEFEEWLTPFEGSVGEMRVHPDRVQFALTAESLFSPGSALLRPESQALLDRVATILKSIDAHLMVEAHTDDLKVDSPYFATNWELGAMRSATVARYLVDGHFMDPSKITAMSAAEHRPIADNSTPEGRARNRRIDIYVIPDKGGIFNIRTPASSQ